MGTPALESHQNEASGFVGVLPLHRLKHSRMLLLPLRLMLMLDSCTAITTPTITTATMDSPGMLWDVRGVMLKLPLMLMLVCIGITTPTTTTATMDSPGMCMDARGVMLRLPQRLMLMLDILDTILIMATEDTMATILDKHYAELERDAYSGNLHVSTPCIIHKSKHKV